MRVLQPLAFSTSLYPPPRSKLGDWGRRREKQRESECWRAFAPSLEIGGIGGGLEERVLPSLSLCLCHRKSKGKGERGLVTPPLFLPFAFGFCKGKSQRKLGECASYPPKVLPLAFAKAKAKGSLGGGGGGGGGEGAKQRQKVKHTQKK